MVTFMFLAPVTYVTSLTYLCTYLKITSCAGFRCFWKIFMDDRLESPGLVLMTLEDDSL